MVIMSQEESEFVYNRLVEEMPFSIRLHRAFRRLGVKTVMGIMRYSSKDFLRQPNVGSGSLDELKTTLDDLGIIWPDPMAAKILETRYVRQ